MCFSKNLGLIWVFDPTEEPESFSKSDIPLGVKGKDFSDCWPTEGHHPIKKPQSVSQSKNRPKKQLPKPRPRTLPRWQTCRSPSKKKMQILVQQILTPYQPLCALARGNDIRSPHGHGGQLRRKKIPIKPPPNPRRVRLDSRPLDLSLGPQTRRRIHPRRKSGTHTIYTK